MLYCDRIDVSEGTDVNKTSASKESIVCYDWCFLNKGFKFHTDVSNGYHDALMMSMNISDTTILNIHSVDYRCIINRVSKSTAVNLLQTSNFNERSETL